MKKITIFIFGCLLTVFIFPFFIVGFLFEASMRAVESGRNKLEKFSGEIDKL